MANDPCLNWSDYPELLKPCDVQRLLSITRDRAYRLFHTDGFPSVRTGRTALCVPKGKLIQWLGYGQEHIGQTAGKEKE